MRKTAVKTKAPASPADSASATPDAPVATLSSIMESLLESDTAPVFVDITRFLGSGEKTLLTWRMPTIARVYAVSDDAAGLMRNNPDWKPQLAYDVATLSACHVAPDPGELGIGAFYTMVCKTNNDLWAYLMEELRRVFPQLKS
ncbi:MAG: hypothetical protein V4671_22625 [Armatimonadota bacterium]